MSPSSWNKPKPFVFQGSLASQLLASPACSSAKAARSDRCVCCALLWGLAAVPSANASFLGQCFWKPWELNKHLCCSLVFFSGTSNLHGRLTCFISTSKQFIVRFCHHISVEFRDSCSSWKPECVSLFCHQHKEYSANSKCFNILTEILYN